MATYPVAITRDAPGRPWDVLNGGVRICRCKTLDEAKEFALLVFGVEKWRRVGPGYYEEAA